MKPETKLTISKFVMIAGLVAIAAGSVMVFNYLFPPAYAQNITQLNNTMNSLETLLDEKQHLNISYLVIFLVLDCAFMATMFKFRNDQYGTVFAIAAVVLTTITALILMLPNDIVYEATNTHLTVEEISWPNGSKTYNTAFVQNTNIDPLFPYNSQIRLILSAFFSVLAIFNALFGILILMKKV